LYDLVIKNGLIVTMDKKRRVFHGDIGIESNEIAFVGEELRSDLCGSDTKVIDASGKIVLPGFVNTHVHTTMGLFRGLGDDLDLLSIHAKVNYPMCGFVKKEEAYSSALLCCIEMLKGGTTTFLDNQYLLADPENTSMVCKAVAEVGLRGNIEFGLQDDPIAPTRWSSISECESMLDYLLETWHHKENDRIKIWLHPVIPGVWETPEMCKQARIWADKYGLRITTHLGDTWDRVKTVQERYGDKNITLFCERTGLQ
jgi:5-methylthioadenosine/S-adenosylhomocysteine deaminase